MNSVDPCSIYYYLHCIWNLVTLILSSCTFKLQRCWFKHFYQYLVWNSVTVLHISQLLQLAWTIKNIYKYKLILIKLHITDQFTDSVAFSDEITKIMLCIRNDLKRCGVKFFNANRHGRKHANTDEALFCLKSYFLENSASGTGIKGKNNKFPHAEKSVRFWKLTGLRTTLKI